MLATRPMLYMPTSFFLNLCRTCGMKNEANVLDVFSLVFVAFAPPAISFFGVAVATSAAEEVVNAAANVTADVATRQELAKSWYGL